MRNAKNDYFLSTLFSIPLVCCFSRWWKCSAAGEYSLTAVNFRNFTHRLLIFPARVRPAECRLGHSPSCWCLKELLESFVLESEVGKFCSLVVQSDGGLFLLCLELLSLTPNYLGILEESRWVVTPFSSVLRYRERQNPRYESSLSCTICWGNDILSPQNIKINVLLETYLTTWGIQSYFLSSK